MYHAQLPHSCSPAYRHTIRYPRPLKGLSAYYLLLEAFVLRTLLPVASTLSSLSPDVKYCLSYYHLYLLEHCALAYPACAV